MKKLRRELKLSKKRKRKWSIKTAPKIWKNKFKTLKTFNRKYINSNRKNESNKTSFYFKNLKNNL
jgi:hypothetical protein